MTHYHTPHDPQEYKHEELVLIANALENIARQLDKLGMNDGGKSPGTTEFIGMQLEKIAENIMGLSDK